MIKNGYLATPKMTGSKVYRVMQMIQGWPTANQYPLYRQQNVHLRVKIDEIILF